MSEIEMPRRRRRRQVINNNLITTSSSDDINKGDSLAEISLCSFPLRCEIQFGNSISYVKQHEIHSLKDDNDPQKLVYSGTISGVDTGDTTYCFDSDQKLIFMGYSYSYSSTPENGSFDTKSRKDSQRMYDLLFNGLKSKYGNPNYHYDIIMQTIHQIPKGNELFSLFQLGCQFDSSPKNSFEFVMSYQEGWIIESDNNYVFIHLREGSDRVTGKLFIDKQNVELGYTYISRDDYSRMVQQKKTEAVERAEAQKKMLSDFLNDL